MTITDKQAKAALAELPPFLNSRAEPWSDAECALAMRAALEVHDAAAGETIR